MDRSEFIERVLKRVDELKNTGGIPAAIRGVGLGWGLRGRHFSYGGFASDANDDFWQIIEAVRAAQTALFEDSLPTVRTELLSEYAKDLIGFNRRFAYDHNDDNWHRIPILHELDVTTFAELSMSYLEAGHVQELGHVFEELAKRHQLNEEWDVEKVWANKVRGEMRRIATEKGPTAEAQLRVFFAYNWKFKNRSND